MRSGNGAGVGGALDAKVRLTRAGLAIRALRRRVDALGIRAAFAPAIPAGTRLVYVDIGMHKRALQLRFMKDMFGKALNLRTIGFEAHPDYFGQRWRRSVLARTTACTISPWSVPGKEAR